MITRGHIGEEPLSKRSHNIYNCGRFQEKCLLFGRCSPSCHKSQNWVGSHTTPTHLYMHGIQRQWKIITTNALKTTSKGELVISTVGTVHPTPNFGPISLKKGPNFHSAPAVSASAAAAASSAASSPTPRDSTPPGSPSFSSPSPVATLVVNNKFSWS